MNIYVKNTIIFLAIVIAIALVYITIKTVYKFINIKDAFENSWFNTDKCGEKMCKSVSPVPEFPLEINLTNWSTDIAKYSAEIVYRIEKAAQNKTSIEYLPNTTVYKELYNDKRDPIFGSVMENNGVIFVGFRGTLTGREFANDLDIQQEKYLNNKSVEQVEFKIADDGNPFIHKGFMDVYNNIKTDLMDALVKFNPNKDKPVIVTGHSLGAAISTIVGLDLSINNYHVVVYNYASPKVGDQAMCDIINNSITVFRVVNTEDIVPNLPSSVSPNFTDISKPYIYAHCGVLKSFTDNWLSTLNNHLIPVYMKGLETM
jgi:triacylglycerol lipase